MPHALPRRAVAAEEKWLIDWSELSFETNLIGCLTYLDMNAMPTFRSNQSNKSHNSCPKLQTNDGAFFGVKECVLTEIVANAALKPKEANEFVAGSGATPD